MTIIFEDFSPIFVGDTLTPFAPVFQQINQTTGKLEPVNLTGLTMTMKMSSGPVTKTCTGPWVTDDAANGLAHYTYEAADVNTVGLWQMQIALSDSSGDVAHTDMKLLEIQTPL